MSLTTGMHRSIKQIWQNVPVPRRDPVIARSAHLRAAQPTWQSADVCICYVTEDVQEAAQLSEALLQQKLSTWTFCCSEHQGGLWPYEIRKRLLYANFLIVYVSPHLLHSDSQRRAIRQVAKLWQQTQIGEAYLIPVQAGASTAAPFVTQVRPIDVASAQGIKTLLQTIAHQCQQRTIHQRIEDFEPEARRMEECLDPSAIASAYRNSVLFTRKIDGVAIQKRIQLHDNAEIASALSYLDYLKNKLDSPSDQLLIRFMLISIDVWQALNQFHASQQWLTLRRVRDELGHMIDELGNHSESYAVRLGFVAIGWRQILANIVQETAPAIVSPYVPSGALQADEASFVGRESTYVQFTDMLAASSSRYQPILLHGSRGIGKSSLLNQLGGALPASIFPIVIPMKKVVRAVDESGLLLKFAKEIQLRVQEHRALDLPTVQRHKFEADPLGTFNGWLGTVDQCTGGKTMLLVLDDFEQLFAGANPERYSEEIVRGLVRSLLLPRPHIKLMLSSTLTMKQLSYWDHSFINLRPLHLDALDEESAHQLVRRPTEHFVLQYDPAVSVRMAELTGRHPFLLQLFCNEIVAYKNEQHPASRYFVVRDDLEVVTPRLLSAARAFFSTIEEDLKILEALTLIQTLATFAEGAIVSLEELQQTSTDVHNKLALLLALEVVEEVNGRYRIKIELMRRHFAS